MKTIVAIKKDLEFNTGLSALIETLKTIAVQQYRALEQKIKTYKEFILSTESFFEFIDVNNVRHKFINPDDKSFIVVAVTSDSGFLGGLNMNVINKAMEELKKNPGELIIIGERGKSYIRGLSIKSVSFPGIVEEERYGQAMQLRDYITNRVLNESFGFVKVIYPRPVTFTVQRVETVSFLPFSPSGIHPAKKQEIDNTLMESTPANIIEYLVYLWMGQKLYEIFGMSKLAEFAARYIHLEESAQKLKDMDRKIRLEYFRVRHELIDRTMREIFAGRLNRAQ